MDIQASKIELIKMIADIESERLIEKLKKFLRQEIKNGKNGNAPSLVEEPEPEWLTLAKQPMPDHLDLDAISKEQGYDPQKLSDFFKNRDRNIWNDENFEELVELLKNDK